ncbi:hypothetical protein CcaverHIS002_0312140 [Cutaneotrichosporon cavernicola]|uniref:Uncharacterized protein n=1 Tax=Cutaneotrichosporon cavernicola TaxID=279322 RepID=A0AA48L383_9TREE|nr:uncharacterized protein CcaverHIS019_0312010 [Cutaneotrichosporon cavernicola]BEI83346.1 hypothetical protein CcaverHIS002_0312140 [Cutaneotrichosporon cavernicola]BEI91131.1 hypothetical protein CcaverHIS019_0312010 [Cutaneotrichosporon cavernicola]BEI98908.1 hypothetical protein CcaverHIS631_0312070 [Cutaneotrichosporon cavernicola]
MSMLRFLASGGGKGKIHPPQRGSLATATSSNAQIKLKLVVPNWGVMYLPAPELPLADGEVPPRHDFPLNGELEVTLPPGGSKRCKSIRVGLKTIITLDLGGKRRYEEDVLFERKVEIVSSTADGIWLEEGLQRFDFTIIVPADLASHDWHTNGVISHVLYAELEGLPDPHGMARGASANSLFGLRKGSRSSSRAHSQSRGTSPASPSRSPGPRGSVSGPSRHAGPSESADIQVALSNLAAPTPGFPFRTPGSSPVPSRSTSPVRSASPRLNPVHMSGAHNLSITREEEMILPRVPSYDDSMAQLSLQDSAANANASPDWILGTHVAKRNCLIVYNPNPMGGINELADHASGYVPGLGVWTWRMVSDVWCIAALLSFDFHLTEISPATTVFSVRLLLNQTHSIVSPRDPDGKPHEFVRTFTIMSEGKRPPEGYYNPDLRHAAIWRGKEAKGKREGGEITIDNKVRMPNDNVARPSTVPGVVTPISVSHTMTLEVAFSVWGEDDTGNKMDHPTFGGLRVLRVSRPVSVPSCCLVPAVLDLPTYGSHEKDRIPGPADDMPTGLPGWEWCACGWQISELESRMRQSIFAQQAEAAARAGGGSARSSISEGDSKMANERERGRQNSR